MKFTMANRFILAIGLGIFLCAGSIHAQTSENKPLVIKIGAYIVSINDFNEKSNSFRSVFWLWALTPNGQGEWMKSLEFPVSISLSREHYTSVESVHGNWSTEEVNGVFREEWNRANYPFDSHELSINLEESNQEASEIQFAADTEGSNASQTSLPSDWKITKMEMKPYIKKYATRFGEPNASIQGTGSEYAGMKVVIHLERTSTTIFWKFTIVPCVAAILCLFSFLLIHDSISIMAKFSLLIGTLLSVILCMASSSTAIGADNVFTLVDKIHIASLLYILLAIFCAIISRWFTEFNIETSKIIRWNFIFGISGFFVVIFVNFRLVYTAMH